MIFFQVDFIYVYCVFCRCKEPLNKLLDDSGESNWPEEEEKLVQILQYGAKVAIQEGLIETEDKSMPYILSGVISLLILNEIRLEIGFLLYLLNTK